MQLLERDNKGRWIPGQSGNPKGRAKGLRNYITNERLMFEAALRDYIADPSQAKQLLEGIDRVLKIAVKGEDKDAISAMKLLLDRVMPAMPPKLEDDAGNIDKKLTVVILTNPNAKVAVQAIEGEYDVIEDLNE